MDLGWMEKITKRKNTTGFRKYKSVGKNWIDIWLGKYLAPRAGLEPATN